MQRHWAVAKIRNITYDNYKCELLQISYDVSFTALVFGGKNMKRIKRVLALILCGAMLVGNLPTPVFAEDLFQQGLDDP